MDCVSQQKHIIVIVEMRTNCGCRQVEHYEESPIVSSQGITSQIPKVGFPQTTAENELRKEIIWEFCKILNNLKCGIHQDLDFILSKLALIAKAKYEHELEPSSQLEDVLRPIFNELQVDMDNLTTEEVDELIRKYENVTLLLRGPRGPRGLDGTVAFENLTPEQIESLRGSQGVQGNTPIIQSGTIVTGNSGTSVVATLTPNGNDTNGNPIYLLNLTIPRGNPFVYSDFTQQQLEGLKGKSAYQLYVDNTSDNPVLSESDWINSLYGTDGITPHIDQTTGNWFIGNINTNIRASFSNLPAEENGTDLSLVTTGEKYLWNNISDILGNPDNSSQNASIDFIVDVEEDGFYFIDGQGNIGAQLTENGFNAIGLHDVLRITNY